MAIEQLFQLKNLREVPIDYEFENDKTIPCRIKNSGRIGQYFGNMFVAGTKWAIVLLGGHFEPQFFEADNVEVLKMKWVEL